MFIGSDPYHFMANSEPPVKGSQANTCSLSTTADATRRPDMMKTNIGSDALN